MDQELKYPWQEAVLDAFMAPPGSVLRTIAIAQTAISARMKALESSDREEQVALHDALRALRVLVRETEVTELAEPKKQEDIA